MTAIEPMRAVRARQLAAIAVPATRVLAWQPMAAATLGGLAIVALGSPDGVPFRLSVAGACLAASTAYLIDDPAATTIAASPTSQPARRSLRAVAAVAGAGIGWTVASIVAVWRVGDLAVRPATASFLTLVVVALAAASVAAAVGNGTEGAIAGVAFTMACYASTFLPAHRWLPFPPDAGAPGATRRLLLIAVAAGAAIAYTARDAAGRAVRPPRPARSRHRESRQPRQGGSP